jgi:hypothetical protein
MILLNISLIKRQKDGKCDPQKRAKRLVDLRIGDWITWRCEKNKQKCSFKVFFFLNRKHFQLVNEIDFAHVFCKDISLPSANPAAEKLPI